MHHSVVMSPDGTAVVMDDDIGAVSRVMIYSCTYEMKRDAD